MTKDDLAKRVNSDEAEKLHCGCFYFVTLRCSVVCDIVNN